MFSLMLFYNEIAAKNSYFSCVVSCTVHSTATENTLNHKIYIHIYIYYTICIKNKLFVFEMIIIVTRTKHYNP